MADSPTWRSPIGRADLDGPLALHDRSAWSKVLVRADDSSPTAATLGVRFGGARRDVDALVAGIRPDEWLVLGPRDGVDRLLAAVPAGPDTHRIDITHGRLCLRLTGDHAARALEKLCRLDLADDMTPDGSCAGAAVAKVAAEVIRDDVDGTRSYLLLADRSYGDWFFDAVADAMREFLD